ncbi:MAG: site-specific DNA-methyltransferase [Bacteroidota bacterium]|nr:site-specific DNA-methyltransferase [Bacteroidota bacterium]
MDHVKDETVALVVTSPPYFNYIDYGKVGIGTEKLYEEYLNNIEAVFIQCFKKLIPDGKMIINVTNMKSRKEVEGTSFLYPILSDIIVIMKRLGFIFFDEIVWIKGNANNGALQGKPLFGSYPYPPTPKILDSIFENILVFKKPGKQLKTRFTKEIKQLSKVTKEDWMVITKGIWHIEPDRISNHPASFPIELPRRLIKVYSFVGEKILDPFAGTGTTVMAAIQLGRIGIGYEIFAPYEKFIKQKYDMYINQQSLFK